MNRVNAHQTETKARDYVRGIIDNYYDNGDALFRDITERDYGIDGIVELFENGIPSGKIAFVQIKRTNHPITTLKSDPNHVSCCISSSNACYAGQKIIPVMLIYSSIAKAPCFYYARLQDILTESHQKRMIEQNSITVRIPAENSSVKTLDRFFDLIKELYEVRG